MKYLEQKDKKRRRNILANEVSSISLKVLSYNAGSKGRRFFYTKLFHNVKNNFSKSTVRSTCVLSGRTHSVDRWYRLSRIKLREEAASGRVYGLTKSSW